MLMVLSVLWLVLITYVGFLLTDKFVANRGGEVSTCVVVHISFVIVFGFGGLIGWAWLLDGWLYGIAYCW